MNELVTCITPTYNRAKLLKEAIESTIAQTYKNWEMIIIDDGSTDDTEYIVKKYIKIDNRIRYYKNPNKGANNARNMGIEKARGEYIAFLDDDDVSLPHRFENQIKAMKRSGSRFIVSWFEVRDRDTGLLIKTDQTILKGAGAGYPSRWMIEKSVLVEVGGFNPKMVAMQENELSYRIANIYSFIHHCEVVTIMYNTHNSTSKGEKGIIGRIQLVEEVGNMMSRYEKAWWYISIASGYYRIGKVKEFKKYYSRASDLDKRIIYKLFYNYLIVMSIIGSERINKINSKILNKLSIYLMPQLYNHTCIIK